MRLKTIAAIEIVNTGRYPDWFDSRNQTPAEEYTGIQIDAVIELITHLKTTYPNIKNIKRHSDLDVDEIPASDNPDILIRRKIDPGPLFPWHEVLRKII
ncbi:MAG: hypothetical protein GY950_01670 [bacterium]|nr:hypothetical protein [bacterium]